MKQKKHLLLCALLLQIGIAQGRNIAFLVGVSNYENENIVNTSALNDIDTISGLLSRQESNTLWELHTLTESTVTKQRITESFNKLLLEMSSGDNFLFYFSGHGKRLPDDNNDESDGYDECLALYNAGILSQDEGYLRDDELESYLNQIRQKLGKDGGVTLLIDACFSGTIEKGIGNNEQSNPKGINVENNNFESVTKDSLLCPIYIMSAAQSNGIAYETDFPIKVDGKPCFFGIFTLSFCEAIQYWDEDPVSFERLANTVKEVMMSHKQAAIPYWKVPQEKSDYEWIHQLK